MSLVISFHAFEQFRQQAPNLDQKSFSNKKITQLLLSWWAIGNKQEATNFGSVGKFFKYGEEDSEHRRANGWVLTRVDNTIVTVHHKTRQEKRRDKRRKLKANQKKSKKF